MPDSLGVRCGDAIGLQYSYLRAVAAFNPACLLVDMLRNVHLRLLA
jgi:hypothetical protein